ncbi:HNH endonuclease signature motif containing protein [Herbaspirillum sp.]|uniref:HNH endonuclease n=1 Tax=Herbaspirillum sp. TaxID=1890675 RepID=UPI0025C5BDA6|nr:HNH endonuclease signature motif containing protein [Herbaspirillum sp.]
MKKRIGELASRDAVLEAIGEYNRLGTEGFLKTYKYTSSYKYQLRQGQALYDAQAIVGAAFSYEFGTKISQNRIESDAKDIPLVLARLGFNDVVERLHPALHLVKGNVYTRTQLNDLYGGQLQSGIWTPREFPVVFMFSGESGAAYGYHDQWTSDDVFEYVGEGQAGDMEFTKGNKAIVDHRKNGEDLLLFKDLGKRKGVRYEGLFECLDARFDDGVEKAKDEEGRQKKRKIIVFKLVRVGVLVEEYSINEGLEATSNLTLDQLRQAALDAVTPPAEQKKTGETRSSWYVRSQTVRSYVLARAKGICEACGRPAPFKKKNGEPYLETHHTTRLADQGLDHPDSVGAVCPTCHRNIHSGLNGDQINAQLKEKLHCLTSPLHAADSIPK